MQKSDLKKLLNDMSIDEKVGQLVQLSGDFFETNNISMGPKENLNISQKMIDLAGSVLNVAGAQVTSDLQRKQMSKQPHHIPLLFMSDIIYGYKTIFPIPLGLGATWNPDLVEKAFSIQAKEGAVAGNHVTYAPMIDVARDARWGRILESPGEDPYLNSVFAKSMVKGFQKNLNKGLGQAACFKHFAAYGGVEAGKEYNAVDMSMSKLYQNYLPPYKAAVKAGAKMAMTSLSSLNGIPSTGDKWLLNHLLRKTWDFNGVIISDYASIQGLVDHGYATDNSDAAKKAMDATVDIDMKSPCYSNHLKNLIENGKLSEEKLNDAVWRVLSLKNELGLFENPFRNADKNKEKEVLSSRESRSFARKVADEAIVLLQNKNRALPLNKNEKIALIGPYSKNKKLLGLWTVHADLSSTVTVSEGIENLIGQKFAVAKGTDLTRIRKNIDDLNMYSDSEIDKMVSSSEAEELNHDEAIKIAKQVDTVILALGEDTWEAGEAGSKGILTLPDNQVRLITDISKLSKKIILVLISGRPLVLTNITNKVDAIIEAWFPGSEGGNAIADVLYGEVNPSGRLTVTFPCAVGQEPIYYSHTNTGRPYTEKIDKDRFLSRYLDISTQPLYPFGYGLSYGSSTLSNLVLSNHKITRRDKLILTVKLQNDGQYCRKDTIQLYIHDKSASVVQPVKRLIDFIKIETQPNESKKVQFVIKPEELTFFNNCGKEILENGAFDVFVGKSSKDVLKDSFELIN